MKKFLDSKIISTGLAIFSMFFGAGNLMYPIMVGLTGADQTLVAMLGFLITAVVLPTLGLTAMILYNGNIDSFFGRVGELPGKLLIMYCLLIIGPLIAMPRIVTFSHTVTSPFLPNLSLYMFCALFLGISFLATVKESRIMDVLGYIISPVLLVSLIIVITKGLFTGSHVNTNLQQPLHLLWQNLKYGYKTLDILGGIFFGSIVLTILQKNYKEHGLDMGKKKLALISLKSGAIGTSLLGIIYLGLSYLGSYFGDGLGHVNEGELFSAISFRILGNQGALIISTAVLMACFSTIIALAVVIAEYLHRYLLKDKISYVAALSFTFGTTFIMSTFGLSNILDFSAPIIEITYPAIITLTLCNLAYKLWDFKPVKLPVALTLLASLIAYFI